MSNKLFMPRVNYGSKPSEPTKESTMNEQALAALRNRGGAEMQARPIPVPFVVQNARVDKDRIPRAVSEKELSQRGPEQVYADQVAGFALHRMSIPFPR